MNTIKRTNRLPFSFDELFQTDWLGGTTQGPKIGLNTPAVNIAETEHNFEIALAIPGLTRTDINIELDNDQLTVASVKKEEKEEVVKKYSRKEFSYASFKRVFNLPETIETTKIEASFENGILEITLPKKEEAKVQPKRLIEID